MKQVKPEMDAYEEKKKKEGEAFYAEAGTVVRAGDVIMHNDPYGGASHGPDVAFCVPVFLDATLIGFSVTTAHHLDIGALSPGSCGIVDAVDTYAEGLQFKAIKVVSRACATMRSGACCATTSARLTWWWATWKRRSRPPRLAQLAT